MHFSAVRKAAKRCDLGRTTKDHRGDLNHNFPEGQSDESVHLQDVRHILRKFWPSMLGRIVLWELRGVVLVRLRIVLRRSRLSLHARTARTARRSQR